MPASPRRWRGCERAAIRGRPSSIPPLSKPRTDHRCHEARQVRRPVPDRRVRRHPRRGAGLDRRRAAVRYVGAGRLHAGHEFGRDPLFQAARFPDAAGVARQDDDGLRHLQPDQVGSAQARPEIHDAARDVEEVARAGLDDVHRRRTSRSRSPICCRGSSRSAATTRASSWRRASRAPNRRSST